MNIVILYSTMASYFEGTLIAIKEIYPQAKITLIYWDTQKTSVYKNEDLEFIESIPRSHFNTKRLVNFLCNKRPDLIYISGWMDRGYLYAVINYKLKFKCKIVSGIDDQWRGTFKQYVGSLIFKIILNKFYDFFWVAGKPQYYYAKKFGYKDDRIINNLLSCNTYIFNKKTCVNQRFVFLGRFIKEKGIQNLVNAYNKLPELTQKQWPLIIIGDGPLKNEIYAYNSNNIQILPFMQSFVLLKELEKGGVFCLPSNFDQWGVVIHEAAILGYPLLLSEACGANSEFLIEGFNGYSFDPHNVKNITEVLYKVTILNEKELISFGELSHLLGQRINSTIAAKSFLSALNR